jgi:hypothetical protein
MQVAKGLQGEYGWGVFFQQGRHRCVLTGTVSGRPEEEASEDAMWTACAEWANFEPIVRQPKWDSPRHTWTRSCLKDCTHFCEGNEQILHELSGAQLYQEAAPFRKELTERFCMGARKFAEPFRLGPLAGATFPRAIVYVTSASSSRRFQIADGANYWLSGPPSFPPPAVLTLPQVRHRHQAVGNGCLGEEFYVLARTG